MHLQLHVPEDKETWSESFFHYKVFYALFMPSASFDATCKYQESKEKILREKKKRRLL